MCEQKGEEVFLQTTANSHFDRLGAKFSNFICKKIPTANFIAVRGFMQKTNAKTPQNRYTWLNLKIYWSCSPVPWAGSSTTLARAWLEPEAHVGHALNTCRVEHVQPICHSYL